MDQNRLFTCSKTPLLASSSQKRRRPRATPEASADTPISCKSVLSGKTAAMMGLRRRRTPARANREEGRGEVREREEKGKERRGER